MTNWKRQAVGDLPLYQAKTMSWLPGVVQGFTTRRGGVGAAPYDSLNLSVNVGDAAAHVQTNRERLWADLGFAEAQVALAEQVHGNEVGIVTAGTATAPVPGVDALVTDAPDVLLMLFFADCVPVYLLAPQRRVVALVHAGWRGTASNLVGKTAQTMRETFDCPLNQCVAAIGPCIGGDSYEVGSEVADQFRNFAGGQNAGAATAVLPRDELGGKYNLNLRQIIFAQLLQVGFRAASIAVCDEDTFRNKRDFFSYRRDGQTGRMAAFLALQK